MKVHNPQLTTINQQLTTNSQPLMNANKKPRHGSGESR